MGQAKQRQAAKDSGRPWAPVMPVAVSSATGTNHQVRLMEHLGKLSKRAEENTRAALQAARDADSEDNRLGALHTILAGAMALMEREVEQGYAQSAESQKLKGQIACRKGCSFCCHLAVEASIVEAILVWRRASQRADLTAAVHANAHKSANVDPDQRWKMRQPCPMLGADGACQVYEDRPGSCRAFVSVDAKACERSLLTAGTGNADLSVPIVPFPRQIETAISIGVRRACAAENLQSCNVELTAALHLLANDSTAPGRWLAGETVFRPYP